MSQSQVIGNYVYLFGGHSSSVTNVIYRAPISDPTTWVDTNAKLPASLRLAQSQIIGDYVYLFGGYTTSATNVIYRASIRNPGLLLANGELCSTSDECESNYCNTSNPQVCAEGIQVSPEISPELWTSSAMPLGVDLLHASSEIVGDYIYFFGDHAGANYNGDVYRLALNNLDYGNAIEPRGDMPFTLVSSCTHIIGDYIYFFGGRFHSSSQMSSADRVAPTDKIYKLALTDLNDDSSYNIQEVGSLGGDVAFSSSQIIGEYIYFFAGYIGGVSNSSVYRLALSDIEKFDNELEFVCSQNVDTVYSTSQLIENDIYFFGGLGAADKNVNKLSLSDINDGDETCSLETIGTFGKTLSYSTSQLIGDKVYFFGGNSDQNLIHSLKFIDID
jgi:N-acetylneuraminic acid mutarotase